MIDIDLLLFFLTLVIFFYTFELVCKCIKNTRDKKKKNEVEGFDLDDITDNRLLIILCCISSAALIYMGYKYFKNKGKKEVNLAKVKADAATAAAKDAANKEIELEKIKADASLQEKKEIREEAKAAEAKAAEAKAAEAKAAEAKTAKQRAEEKFYDAPQQGGDIHRAVNSMSRFIQSLI